MTEALGVLERRCEGLEKENKTLKASAKLGSSTSGTAIDTLGSSGLVNSPVKASLGSHTTTSSTTASAALDFSGVDYGRLLEVQAQADMWRGLAVHRLTASLRPLPPLSVRRSVAGAINDAEEDDLIKLRNLHDKLDTARQVYFDTRLVRASLSVLDLTSKRQPAYVATSHSTKIKSRPTDKIFKSLDEYRKDLLLAAI
jgi:hypothetical protein